MNARLLSLRPPRLAQLLVLCAFLVHWATPLRHWPLVESAAWGVTLGLAGFAVMLRAWWLFRNAGTAICPTAASSRLLTDDVYRFSRNPMYLGMAAMLSGLAVGMGTAPFFAAVVLFTVVMDRVFIPFEEQKMLHEFGDAYTAYRADVRRWL